jgi:hypothetical protein
MEPKHSALASGALARSSCPTAESTLYFVGQAACQNQEGGVYLNVIQLKRLFFPENNIELKIPHMCIFVIFQVWITNNLFIHSSFYEYLGCSP